MGWITNKANSNDKNRKMDWFQLKRTVLSTVRGDQFLYISNKFDYKSVFWLLQCFSLDFSPPPPVSPLRFLTLYTSPWLIFALHLLIIQTITWVLVLLDTIFGPLWVGVIKAVLFRGLFHINAARKLAAKHSMQWQQLFLRYFWASISLVCS